MFDLDCGVEKVV